MTRRREPVPRPRLDLTSRNAVQSAAAHDDADLLGLVVSMVALGARAKTITRVTGFSAGVVRRMCARDRATGAGTGRLPESIARLFVTRQTHLESSLFLRLFSGLHFYTRTLDARILVEAVRLLHEALGGAPHLAFESYLYVAERFLANDVKLDRCGTCTTQYLASVQMLMILDRLTHGRCPTCRRHAMASSAEAPPRKAPPK